MTKILLVEKRYARAGESPSVTAKWVEIPDGEEALFLEKQLSCIDEIKSLQLEEVNRKPKQKLLPEDIMTIFNYAALPVAILIAYFIYHLVPQN